MTDDMISRNAALKACEPRDYDHAHHRQAKVDCANAIATLPAVEVRDAIAALRLIELIGYRESEEFGWINAHMRGVATSALSGQSIAHYWRLFPNHRPPLTTAPAPDSRICEDGRTVGEWVDDTVDALITAKGGE